MTHEEVMEQDELLLTDEEITGLAMITRPDNPNWLRDLVKNTETLVLAKAKQHYHSSIEAQKLQVELAKKRERERIINIVNTPSEQVGNKVSTNSVALFRKFILRRIGKPFNPS